MDDRSGIHTPEEVEAGRVLRERYLVPYVMTPSQYKGRLLDQGYGVPVPLVRGIPVLLDVGELALKKTMCLYAGCIKHGV